MTTTNEIKINLFENIDNMLYEEVLNKVTFVYNKAVEDCDRVREFAKSINVKYIKVDREGSVTARLIEAFPILRLSDDKIYYLSFDEIAKMIKNYRRFINDYSFNIVSFNDKNKEMKVERYFSIYTFSNLIGIDSPKQIKITKDSDTYQYEKEEDYNIIKYIFTSFFSQLTKLLVENITFENLQKFMEENKIDINELTPSIFIKMYQHKFVYFLSDIIGNNIYNDLYYTEGFNAYIFKERLKETYQEYKKSL